MWEAITKMPSGEGTLNMPTSFYAVETRDYKGLQFFFRNKSNRARSSGVSEMLQVICFADAN